MYEHLSSRERLERIAEILNKGIYLLALKEGWFGSKKCVDAEIPKLTTRQQIILRHIQQYGSISNRESRDLLGISRETAHLDLKGLVRNGYLVTIGRRRNIRYYVNKKVHSSDEK